LTRATDIVAELKGVPEGKGWRSLCPAHDDHTPSLSIIEKDGKVLLRCRAGCTQEEVLDALRRRGLWPNSINGTDRSAAIRSPRIVATYDYRNEAGELLFQVCRKSDKSFPQRRPDGNGGWIWDIDAVRRVLYRLPELLAAPSEQTVFIAEGEKDVNALVKIGRVATCNPSGAGKWRSEFAQCLADRDVMIIPDNDAPGRDHAAQVIASLLGVAKRARILELPGLPEKGDFSDWLARGGTPAQFDDLVGRLDATGEQPIGPDQGVSLGDFYAYMPTHNYIFTPSREMWPAASVNARIPPIPVLDESGKPLLKDDKPIKLLAGKWLDQNRPVEQMTWCPGLPMIISDRLVSEGGWIERNGVKCFNLYRPPIIRRGKPTEIARWLDHVSRVFPDDASHIIRWLAHRVQRPQQKINHALVVGGEPGIGKDTILEPVKRAVGPWNFQEISALQAMGRFNSFLKSVVLRISEARDLGDVDRCKFYEHMKAYTAAPPDVLRCDEKNLREYVVFNVCGVVLTTNYKTNGIYLPANDRRHYVAWSERITDDFPDAYWDGIYSWYDRGGIENVAAYLAEFNLSDFNPKAPPEKTPAFWEIVDASRSPEDAELADVLDILGTPEAVTIQQLIRAAHEPFKEWLADRRNARLIPHRLEECGYVVVRNAGAKDGLWKVNGKRQAIYGKANASQRDRHAVTTELSDAGRRSQ
jgi:hypothetical protein